MKTLNIFVAGLERNKGRKNPGKRCKYISLSSRPSLGRHKTLPWHKEFSDLEVFKVIRQERHLRQAFRLGACKMFLFFCETHERTCCIIALFFFSYLSPSGECGAGGSDAGCLRLIGSE